MVIECFVKDITDTQSESHPFVSEDIDWYSARVGTVSPTRRNRRAGAMGIGGHHAAVMSPNPGVRDE